MARDFEIAFGKASTIGSLAHVSANAWGCIFYKSPPPPPPHIYIYITNPTFWNKNLLRLLIALNILLNSIALLTIGVHYENE